MSCSAACSFKDDADVHTSITGGATSLLALNGLYTLMISHNLQYPSFYSALYALLLSPTAPFLHVRYRARFLRLLDTFLSSSHLPAALIASFAKRLSRAALRAPPAAAVSIVPFVWNLCKRHKGCMEMLHRVYNDDRLADGPAGVVGESCLPSLPLFFLSLTPSSQIPTTPSSSTRSRRLPSPRLSGSSPPWARLSTPRRTKAWSTRRTRARRTTCTASPRWLVF